MQLSPDAYDRLRGLVAQPGSTPTRSIGRFRLRREIGRGGMAVVHEAEDPDLGRTVALKVVPEGTVDPQLIERLRREARVIAQLEHPNIVRVYEVGTARDNSGEVVHYIAMDLVRGRTLAKLLAEARPDRDTVLRMMEEIARAVAHAHSRGIVHRDLKPGNVIVDEQGSVRLVDFGLARAPSFQSQLTASRAVIGTPQYMAPEQLRGRPEETGPWTDVYALGVMLYEVLSGRPPFQGNSMAELLQKALHADPPPLRSLDRAIDPRLEAICGKALEKEKERRYAGVEDLAEDIARFRRGESVLARAPGLTRRVVALIKRRRTLAAALAAGVLALAALSAVLLPRLAHQKERMIADLDRRAQVALSASLAFRRSGRLAEMQQFAQETEQACADAEQQFPDLAEPHYLLARMHREMMKEASALAEVDEALRRQPDHAGALYERVVLTATQYGRRLQEMQSWTFRIGRSGPAAEHARRAADEDPQARELLKRIELDVAALRAMPPAGAASMPAGAIDSARGILAWIRGDLPAAQQVLLAATAASPELDEAWYALAMTEAQKGDFEEAMRHWQEALSRDAGFVRHLEGRAFTQLVWGVQLAEQGGDPFATYDAAVADSRAAMATGREDGEEWIVGAIARLLAGVERIERGQDPTTELDEAARSLSDARGHSLPQGIALWRGICHVAQARAAARRGEDADSTFEAADRDFAEALAIDPGNGAARMWRPAAEVMRGMAGLSTTREEGPLFREAAAALDSEVQRDPQSPDARMWRGTARLGLALLELTDTSPHWKEAMDDLDEAVRLDPEGSARWERRAQAGHEYGALMLQWENDEGERLLEAAIEDGTHAVELNAARIEPWIVLSAAQRELGTHRLQHGRDPRPSYLAALEAASRARAIQKDDGHALEATAAAMEGLAASAAARGEEAVVAYAHALAYYEKALAALPSLGERIQPRIEACRKHLR